MGKRVLLVDDDDKLRKLLKEYLEGYEFHVFTLADGEAVLNSIRKESPEIVILDIMLPKKDGLEVLKEIRAVSRVPVIMLTAKGRKRTGSDSSSVWMTTSQNPSAPESCWRG
jgi:two-component system phosphate regulon response regulator OmpR